MFFRAKESKKSNKDRNKGFSLVELIVVIAIMAVLVAVLAPQFTKYIDRSRQSNDAATVSGIVTAVQVAVADEAYNTSVGTYTITVGDKDNGTSVSFGGTALSAETDSDKYNMVNAIEDSCGDLKALYRTATAWNEDIKIQVVISSNGDVEVTYLPIAFANYIEKEATPAAP